MTQKTKELEATRQLAKMLASQCKTPDDIQNKLKELFSSTTEEILESEMDSLNHKSYLNIKRMARTLKDESLQYTSTHDIESHLRQSEILCKPRGKCRMKIH